MKNISAKSAGYYYEMKNCFEDALRAHRYDDPLPAPRDLFKEAVGKVLEQISTTDGEPSHPLVEISEGEKSEFDAFHRGLMLGNELAMSGIRIEFDAPFLELQQKPDSVN